MAAPVPQPAMLRVAVLGKENWKTNVLDLQPVPGEAGGLEAPLEGSLGPFSTWLGLVGS